MFSRKLVVAMFFVGIFAACAAKGKHGTAKGAKGSPSSKAFNPYDIMMDIVHPTTKASSPEMVQISKAASAAVTTIDSVAGTITGLIDRAKGIQSMTKSVAQDTIDGVVSRAQTTAHRIGGQPGCVTEMMGRAGALGMQLALNEVQCPGNKIAKLEDMLEKTVQSGQTLLTMVPKAALSLDLCERKGGPLEIICRTKIVTDLTGRAGSAGLKAMSVASEAVSMVATIEPSLATCAGLKVGSSAVKAAELVGRFGMCSGKAVMDLIG